MHDIITLSDEAPYDKIALYIPNWWYLRIAIWKFVVTFVTGDTYTLQYGSLS